MTFSCECLTLDSKHTSPLANKAAQALLQLPLAIRRSEAIWHRPELKAQSLEEIASGYHLGAQPIRRDPIDDELPFGVNSGRFTHR